MKMLDNFLEKSIKDSYMDYIPKLKESKKWTLENYRTDSFSMRYIQEAHDVMVYDLYTQLLKITTTELRRYIAKLFLYFYDEIGKTVTAFINRKKLKLRITSTTWKMIKYQLMRWQSICVQ